MLERVSETTVEHWSRALRVHYQPLEETASGEIEGRRVQDRRAWHNQPARNDAVTIEVGNRPIGDNMRLLLIEDETELAQAMVGGLTNHKIVMDHVGNLRLGWEALESPVHDVVILDRNLPDGDGLSFLSRMREAGNRTPVIVLTAHNDLQQRIAGLNEGADDYLGKPFHLEELIARVRALVRRSPTYPDDVCVAGDIELNSTTGIVMVSGVQVHLPRREHIILKTLIRRPDYVVQRYALEEAVYGYDDEIQSNALDSHVSRLRKKLSDLGSTNKIVSVRGVGYMLK